MEQLPSSLLYYTSSIANFTRNTVKLNTLNTQNLASNGASQLRLALPVNAIANLKSLSMRCTMKTDGVAATSGDANAVYALIPRNGPHAVLDRVTWSSGGISLDNGATPYHVIYAMKQNMKKGNQKYMSDDKVLQQSIIEPYTEHANSDHGQTKDFIINNFLGFTECHPAYFDLNLVPEMFLTMQIADKNVLPVQYQGTALGVRTPADGTSQPGFASQNECQFALNNIEFSLEVCQIGSGLYDALTQRLLMERGSIDVPYPQYQVFTREDGTAAGTVRGSVSCMSLDRINAVYRNAVPTTDGSGAPYDAYWKQQPPVPVLGSTSYAFNNAADNFISDGIDTWQAILNNAPMPLFKASKIDAFNFTVCNDDRTYSDNRGGLISSQSMWLNNCFVINQRLCFDEDRTRISGTNLSSINSQLSVQTFGSGGYVRQSMLITEQTSVLRIGQSRAVAVVA